MLNQRHMGGTWGAPVWGRWVLACAAALVVFAFGIRVSAAPGRTCSGDCCAVDVTTTVRKLEVELSVALVGLYEVDDRGSAWVADYWLYEAWPARKGFRPQTEIANEVELLAASGDTTEQKGNRCLRARRFRSRLHSDFDFRRFPFDQQELTITIAESNFRAAEMLYASQPGRSGVLDAVLDQPSGWQLTPAWSYSTETTAFNFGHEDGAKYAEATFTIVAKRRSGFHLAKFFFPLFLIVALAYSAFWIDPEDLNSQVGLGITCLLAAIAFQFTQASNLPEVEYLTLADRVYIITYSLIAVTLIESVYVNALARKSRVRRARRVDRFWRALFPVALAVLVGSAAFVSR